MNQEEFLKKARIKRPECSESAFLSAWEAYCVRKWDRTAQLNKPFYNMVFLLNRDMDTTNLKKVITIVKTDTWSFLNREDPEKDTNIVKAQSITIVTKQVSFAMEMQYNMDINIKIADLQEAKEFPLSVWDRWFSTACQVKLLADGIF